MVVKLRQLNEVVCVCIYIYGKNINYFYLTKLWPIIKLMLRNIPFSKILKHLPSRDYGI